MRKTTLTVEKKSVYVSADRVRVGSKGKPVEPGHFFALFSKGEARKLRKQLAREGHANIAAHKRQPN